MNIVTIVNNMITDLSALSWTSSGTGTTQFEGVFEYENWANTEGYPFLIILDPVSNPANETDSFYFSFDHQIEFYICVNWGVVDKATEALQMKEAKLRIREAWDAMKSHVVKIQTLNDWGLGDCSYTVNFTMSDENIPDLNIMRRKITFAFKELVARR